MTEDLIDKLPENKQHLRDLRITDLIAKVARVTLKDTVRVLLALDTVSGFLDLANDDVLDEEASIEKPTLLESQACADAYDELSAFLEKEGEPDWLKNIREID